MAGTYVVDQGVPTYGSGEPTDAKYVTTPGLGQQYVDQTTGNLYVRSIGPGNAAAHWNLVSQGSLYVVRPSAPATAILASTYRDSALFTDDAAALVSGTPLFYAFDVVQGTTIQAVNFRSGATAAVAVLNQWAGICTGLSSALVVAAISADKTSTAIGANANFSYALTAPWTAPTSQTIYVFLNITVTTTMPSLPIFTTFALTNNVPPILQGVGDTTKTTPYIVGNTPGTLTSQVKRPYIWLT